MIEDRFQCLSGCFGDNEHRLVSSVSVFHGFIVCLKTNDIQNLGSSSALVIFLVTFLSRSPGPGFVHSSEPSLSGREGLLFSFDARLVIVSSLFCLLENPGFLNSGAKPLDGSLKRLILRDHHIDSGHGTNHLLLSGTLDERFVSVLPPPQPCFTSAPLSLMPCPLKGATQKAFRRQPKRPSHQQNPRCARL